MTNPYFTTGNYYHIYNRGVEKRNIFINKRDYQQFLLTMDFYHKTPLPAKLSDFKRGIEKAKKIENQIDLVEIYSYCLMPNHFHFLLKQNVDDGITNFLRKFANSYTRYFNTKHERIGPLFQGTFKAKIIENDEYLLQVSKYIHRNPLKLSNSNLRSYSSYKYYLHEDEHPFCNTEFILSYFSKTNPNLSYQSFVEETEVEDSVIHKLLIDPEED
ncbi:MAG: transposase [Candidatus Levybacteria bacterium]|nr:transposase [Candidatus Levybacteria bacterium]